MLVSLITNPKVETPPKVLDSQPGHNMGTILGHTPNYISSKKG